MYSMTVILTLFTGTDTSVAGIALRAPMRTGAGVCVCPVLYHAQTAGVTHAALPVSLVTSSMVTVATIVSVCMLLLLTWFQIIYVIYAVYYNYLLSI